MPTLSRICRALALTAVLSLVGLAVKADAATRKAQSLSGNEIRSLVSGATVHIHTPLGTVIPVIVGADGSLSGKAGRVAFYLGSKTDRGRWWITGSKLCQKWKIWFKGKSNCMRVRQKGAKLFWRDNKGESGVATIVSRAVVAEKPKVTKPTKFTASAFGLGLPPKSKKVAALPLAEPGQPSMPKAADTPAPKRSVAAVAPAAEPAIPSTPKSKVSRSRPASETAKASETRQRKSPAQPTFRVVGVPARDVLNVRRTPSTRAPVVGTIAPNTKRIRLTGACENAWCPVAHGRNRGWVSRDFLALQTVPGQQREIRPRTVRYKVVRVSSGDVLNIRRRPSAETSVVGTIHANARGIRVAGTCVGEWCPIAHGQRRGWVNRNFIYPVRLPRTRTR